ncbi:hydrolase [Halolactibacillus alkaliphilus]|uniref:Hydrolase n=1 Tax=Halolactibacillus alkaliphilus TaxID=442899 RepID=A0A511X4V5_9BACI|nr:HAD family hydrolase [Halolactibacillus alkaliphilus]GEN57973.1 hydrolase [Halolactibacillus alkaliphilus]GGN76035.1 hydrolase [Halolactibacillus alkaliphilus]SFP09829.1 hypothetical protein SAMN05720591_1472 [Halolactibacillus alkaliphilus]
MISMFVTDLDGTLLKNNRYITKEDKEALQLLNKKGVDITIATGRSDREVQAVFKELNITGHRISQNGTFTFSKYNENVFSQVFEEGTSLKLFDFLHAFDFPCLISNFDNIHYAKEIPMAQTLQSLFKTPLIYQQDLRNRIEQDFSTSKFMLLGETSELLSLEKKIISLFDTDVSTFLSADMCLDIVPKGADKRRALEALLNQTGIKKQATASIGDGFNDINMLAYTPHSYVMSSAEPKVKLHGKKTVQHVYEAVDDLFCHNLIL